MKRLLVLRFWYLIQRHYVNKPNTHYNSKQLNLYDNAWNIRKYEQLLYCTTLSSETHVTLTKADLEIPSLVHPTTKGGGISPHNKPGIAEITELGGEFSNDVTVT